MKVPITDLASRDRYLVGAEHSSASAIPRDVLCRGSSDHAINTLNQWEDYLAFYPHRRWTSSSSSSTKIHSQKLSYQSSITYRYISFWPFRVEADPSWDIFIMTKEVAHVQCTMRTLYSDWNITSLLTFPSRKTKQSRTDGWLLRPLHYSRHLIFSLTPCCQSLRVKTLPLFLIVMLNMTHRSISSINSYPKLSAT